MSAGVTRSPEDHGHERGRTVGRYVILAELGVGGMGRVLSAYDPELDRRVALKLLHTEPIAGGSKIEEYTVRLDGDGGERNLERERILAEARAMARLSHPNLVSVFEVGEVDGQVFLAMEHVSGVTLSTWLRERRRSLGELLRVFGEIGRGLAAAHAAGLVHGDVKPSNVLVEPSGRARVIDFGLARAAQPDGDAAGERGPPVMGTPRYIAPERLAGRAVDARADQFAFAVMLGDAVAEPPAGGSARRRVPRWIERCVARASASDPADRFSSMDGLLRELRRRRRSGRRAVIAVAALAVVVAALLVGRGSAEVGARCDGGAVRLAGVWDATVDAMVRAAMHGSGRPYADTLYTQVSGQLARYRSEWIAMHRQACEATASGEQSSQLLDRRMACLDRRLAGLAQVAAILRQGEEIARASDVVAGLAPLAVCGDTETLLAVVPLPEDPEKRASAAELERTVAAAEVDRQAGHIDVALRSGRGALTRARALGYAPLIARAGALVGRALDDTGHPAEAEHAFLDALDDAVRGRDDALVASIEVELVGELGMRQNRVAEARLLGRVADAALTRAGPATEALERPRLLARLGVIAAARAELAEAEKLETAAIVLLRARLLPDDPRIARSEDLLASVIMRTGRFDEALQHYRAALDISERALGPDHPQVANVLNDLAVCYEEARQPEPARAMYLRALAIVEKLPEYVSTPVFLNNLGTLELNAGHFDLAIGYHERALAVRRARLGPAHPDIANSLLSLGLVYVETGDLERALSLLREALALGTTALGDGHPRVASMLGAIGETLRRAGRPREALPYHTRAIAILEAKLGTDHPTTRWSRAYAALALVDAGQGQEALASIQRGLDGLPPTDPDRVQLLFGLARALLADQDRALAAAREARALAVTLRPHAVASIDRWLAAHAR